MYCVVLPFGKSFYGPIWAFQLFKTVVWERLCFAIATTWQGFLNSGPGAHFTWPAALVSDFVLYMAHQSLDFASVLKRRWFLAT